MWMVGAKASSFDLERALIRGVRPLQLPARGRNISEGIQSPRNERMIRTEPFRPDVDCGLVEIVGFSEIADVPRHLSFVEDERRLVVGSSTACAGIAACPHSVECATIELSCFGVLSVVLQDVREGDLNQGAGVIAWCRRGRDDRQPSFRQLPRFSKAPE
jgi:hypothetical protein